MTTPNANRRDFLKAGTVATATAAAVNLIPTAVHAAGDEAIKVGVIGCGGRGSGAAKDCLQADKSVVIHAVGDAFMQRCEQAVRNWASDSELKGDQERIKVGDRKFAGLDAYKQVIDSGVDLVILATPPGFRPPHLEYAIEKGKHIFCEKPVAVDSAGIRKCLELVSESKKRNLAIVAGTQRRHNAGYIETVKKIQDGAIGDIISARCSWNGQGIWFNPRRKGEPDVAYQIRNWYHFLWLCGDHIVEQHVHNIDVCNWVLGAHPIKASGFGGRMYRREGDPNEVGHIWDHFAVEFEYPNGVPMYSFCTHIPGQRNDQSEAVYGSKGMSQVNAFRINRQPAFTGRARRDYVQEHVNLIQSIKAGKPLNELQAVTESTMTAILGRMAAYSGDVVTWEKALNAKEDTLPKELTMDMELKVGPVPTPSRYKVA
jgi:myo-inositol 2-dehydrogenase/D-chiro-inositol 1-dehydrogenase